MIRIYTGLFLVALTTLLLELTLTRVFDVIWYPNMAYLIITMAIFSFGLAGVYMSLRPPLDKDRVRDQLVIYTVLFGLFTAAILPMLNYLANDSKLMDFEWTSAGFFAALYLTIAIPFFFSGLVFATIFSLYAEKISKLYFWDLVGAAVGTLILIPVLPVIGGEKLLYLAVTLSLISAALFARQKSMRIVIGSLAAFTIAATAITPMALKDHINKRGLGTAESQGRVTFSKWDPISKIDVVYFGPKNPLWIGYDGGTQSSWIYRHNGNFKQLRERLDAGHVRENFPLPSFLTSHYIKRDSDQEVLVIGGGGGLETRAALTYGAKHVDVVELVGTVVEIGKNNFARINGHIYKNRKVNAMKGEGRTFLRSTDKKYDIIQIMSNHSSSSIAAGGGAVAPTNLQTVEAYKEYFSHLTDNGILHINHHISERMIVTAARAWKEMGRSDFAKHVILFEANVVDYLPTLLIKTSPWTEQELKDARKFEGRPLKIDPIHPQHNYLPPVFLSGEKLPKSLVSTIHYDITAATDDKPYLNFIRKRIRKEKVDKEHFMSPSIAGFLNAQLNNGVPLDIAHLLVSGFIGLVFSLLFIFVPLLLSRAGRTPWDHKPATLAYFAAIGAGFITFELTYIQIFMKPIGYPLYTYSIVVFTFLFGAGLGSYMSEKFGVVSGKRWPVPFVGIVVTALLFLLLHHAVFEIILGYPAKIRLMLSAALIFPLTFFLGMAFPMGIFAIKDRPEGTVAWAWALNGLFTAIGGFGSAILTIYIGFKATLAIAIVIYIVAASLYRRIRGTTPATA